MLRSERATEEEVKELAGADDWPSAYALYKGGSFSIDRGWRLHLL